MSIIISFISFFLLTFCFSYYTKEIQRLNILRAGTWSGLVTLVNMIGISQVINNPVAIIGAVLGSVIGTGLSVFIIKNK